MALKKSKTLATGVVGEYWKIVDLNINWLTNQAHVAMCLWVDQQARLDGKQPLESQSFDWSGTNFPFTDEEPQNERATAYTKIKESNLDEEGNEQNWFADATDVL